MICSMAAFKHHCSFTFFKADMTKDPHQLLSKVGKSSMGHIGKLKTQQKRLASAIEWIKEGNPRNWKYMKRL